MTARLLCAWFVHLYTALGAVLGFLAIRAIQDGDFKQAFQLMFIALVIDATDGFLARAARVKELIPWFDGARLDDIIDYFNYVIVPCIFFQRAELLPPQDALWLVSLPLLASAYGFSRKDAKTADYFFLGFPSYWNIVAFYLYVLKTPLWLNAFVVMILSILIFVPIRYIYPSRSPRFRVQTNFFGFLWGLALGFVIYRLPEPPAAVVIVSLLYPAYYFALSLWLELRRLRG